MTAPVSSATDSHVSQTASQQHVNERRERVENDNDGDDARKTAAVPQTPGGDQANPSSQGKNAEDTSEGSTGRNVDYYA